MKTKLTVYLAGSIVGCTTKEAKLWRWQVKSNGGFNFYDPADTLRCLADDEVYGQTEKPFHIDGARALYQRDLFMLNMSDIVVIKLDPKRKQIGSMFELGYSVAHGKPIIFLADDHEPEHPFILCSGLVVKSIKELMEALVPYSL